MALPSVELGSLPAAQGDPMELLSGLNRHWDGVGVLVMARRKPGARLPPQPSAFMKVATGSPGRHGPV